MSQYAFVTVLSGGLDSAVAMAVAARSARPVLAITFEYGQPSAVREIAAARLLAGRYACEHRVIRLGWYGPLLPAGFSAGGAAVPEPEAPDRASARAVWVPGRNLVFLAVAAAWAERLGAGRVVVGFNAEEAGTFPDNSAGFVEAANAALRFSSDGAVTLAAPLAGLDKAAIVRLGRELGISLGAAWSCYRGGAAPCGRCESCRRRAAAGG
jgi:7-cyano-7-deazaguanine synthase